MRSLPALLSFAAITTPCFGQAISQKQWETADRQVLRLPPTAFEQLPKNLIAELQRRGCTIPQVPMIRGRQNAIKGEFAKPGEKDWAVLCSIAGVSTILVFWNASEIKPAEIATGDDMDRLQSWSENKIVYSRKIEPVRKPYIMEHYRAYGGPKPPPINHEGINDVFVGKASVVLYFYRGKWLQLSGAD